MHEEKKRPITITDPRHDRYARLHLIDWWDQERIRAAYVMVVGAGALGNEVLKNLALLGIGHLFIVDFDVIEASNLTRAVLFRPEDGGRRKASVAAERVQAINADVSALAFTGDVTRELGTGVYRQMDVVISCLDNRAARLALNAACWQTATPWVDGALSVMDGLVRVFTPPHGACYECLMTERDYRLLNLRYSCPPGFVVVEGVEPTLPTTASIIAAMQVQETIKLLHKQPVQHSQAMYYSGGSVRTMPMRYNPRQDCPAHTVYDPIIPLPSAVSQLTVGQLLEQMRPFVTEGSILALPRDIVTRLYCQRCAETVDVYRPYEQVVPAQVPCPRCGALRIFDVASSLGMDFAQRDLPLTQLNIPPWHILPVRTESRWLYFELAGDKQVVLPDWFGNEVKVNDDAS